MDKLQVVVEKNKCIGCSLCVKTCPAHNLKIQEGKAQVILEDCLFCGQCEAVCPRKAVTVSGYDHAPQEKNKEERLDPGQVLNTIRFRRTVRQFQNKPVPTEVVKQILEAGWMTHTAENKRDVSFIVLDQEKERFEKLAVNLFRKIKPLADLINPLARNNVIDDHFFFFKAPLVILVLAEDKTNGLLAAQNMEFVAEANGLGVLFSGFFTMAANLSPKIKNALQIPKGKKVAMTLVMGYPGVRYLRSVPRKEMNVQWK